ncbi:MAG: hypothetical protein FDZ69_04630 [Deltaproteobacteria bacterium]|nr:MAG: hypothetical protein FDZ69_04630 [Deltaproteobacteria bacterium]
MCNAWNHSLNCTCGFGGEGHLGGGGGYNAGFEHPTRGWFQEKIYAWDEAEFCAPSKCPICGEDVFFIRHNGGSVWVDDLGWPWPRHGCFDSYQSRGAFTPAVVSAIPAHQILDPELGLVVRASQASGESFAQLLVRHSNGEYLRMIVENGYADLAGEIICFSREKKQVVLLFNEKKVFDIIKYKTAKKKTKLTSGWREKDPDDNQIVHNAEPVCPYCNMEVDYRKLIKHLCRHHNHVENSTETRLVRCDICNRLFSKKSLLMHVISDHII